MSSLVKPVKPAAPNQHSCTTKGRFDEFSIKWTIEDAHFYLSKWMKNSGYYGHNPGQMESAVNFTNNGERQWKLVITPRSKSDPNNRTYGEYAVYLDVSLVLVNAQKPISTNFSLSIIDGHGRKMNTRKQPTTDITYGQPGLLDSYIKLDDLLSNENLLPNDTLTLLCEVKALVSYRTETSSVATSRTLPALEQLHIPD